MRHATKLILASVILAGCDMTPEQSQRLMAISGGLRAASQSLQASENANYMQPSMMTRHLRNQWLVRGGRMCQYSDGTVLNMGINLCPLSI